MRCASLFLAATWAAVCLAASPANAQFTAPANSLVLDESGTFELLQGSLVRIRNSKGEAWLLKIIPDTRIVVDGDADRAQLRPGVFVQLECEIDDDNAVKEPIAEIAIISPQAKGALGLYPVASKDEDPEEPAQPVRAPSAGSYLVKGKLTVFRNGELLILAGRHKITGTVVEDQLKVKLQLDDISLAQLGDAVKVKAWYFPAGRPNPNFNKPGEAIADELTITLAEPPAPAAKKPRQAERRERPAAKSRVAK